MLDKATLKTAIKAAFQGAIGDEGDAEENVAVALSDAIDAFVKSGTVSTTVTTPNTINGTGVGAVT